MDLPEYFLVDFTEDLTFDELLFNEATNIMKALITKLEFVFSLLFLNVQNTSMR